MRLKRLVDRGLRETAALWPSVQNAFDWVHRAATILKNEDKSGGAIVRKRLAGLLGAMARHQAKAAGLRQGVAHFIKVSRSYWPGLFHCYDDPDLPRTNNDLERQFGSFRRHERRITGRKTASPAMVHRGQARLLAQAATRRHPYAAVDLATTDRQAWRELRAQLDARRSARRWRTRFRRNPTAFLANLEEQLLQLTLPF